jgi:hypothetical protein
MNELLFLIGFPVIIAVLMFFISREKSGNSDSDSIPIPGERLWSTKILKKILDDESNSSKVNL